MAQWQKGRLSLETGAGQLLQFEHVGFMLEMLIATWTEHVFLQKPLTEQARSD